MREQHRRRVVVTCNKMSFGRKEDAFDEVKLNKNCASMADNRKLIPYLCTICGFWHLTSAKRMKHQKRERRFKVI